MAVLLLGTRLALVTVSAVAGFTKFVDRPGTQKAVADFGIPFQFARPIATIAGAHLSWRTVPGWSSRSTPAKHPDKGCEAS
jgi:hypothetical protein